MPTGPGEWGISVDVLGVDTRACIQQHLDRRFVAEGGRAVQRRFTPGADIAHERFRFD